MVIVITGASSGIGRAAARELAVRGHALVVVGRNPERTEAVAREVHGHAVVADFDQLSQVHDLADTLLARYPKISGLANNAGGLLTARGLTANGLERTWQHNVLAPFVLTQELLPRLIESRARVVFTGSDANRWSAVHLDDPGRDRMPWLRGAPAYGASKRADIMLAREVARRYPQLTSFSFHPGPVATAFAGLDSGPLAPLIKRAIRSPEEGAAPLVRLLDGELTPPSGSYVDGTRVDRRVARQALDPVQGAALWDLLTAQSFQFS